METDAKFFEHLTTLADLAYWRYVPDSQTWVWSKRLRALLGWPDEANTPALFDILDDALDQAELKSAIEQAGTTPFDIELRFCRSDGTTFDACVSARATQHEGTGELEIYGLVQPLKRQDGLTAPAESPKQTEPEGVEIGLIDVDLPTKRIYLSPEMSKMMGTGAAARWETTTWFVECIHPEDFTKLQSLWLAQRDTRQTIVSEFRLKTAAQDYLWVEARWRGIINGDGEMVRIVSSVANIHERKLQEAAVIRVQERLDLAIDLAGLGIWECDLSTGEIEASDQFYEILGLPASTRMTFEEYIARLHPQERDAVIDNFFDYAVEHNSAAFDLEHRLLHENGDYIWVHANGRMKNGPDGASEIGGVIADISERKASEIELLSSERRFHSVVDLLGEAVFEMDANLNYTYISDRIMDISGYKPEEIIGRSAFDFTVPRGVENFKPFIAALEQDPGHFKNREVRATCKDGRMIWVRLNGTPLFNTHGERIGWRGAILDITERKKTEQELINAKKIAEEAAKAKAQFLATMSHEIRTPLNAVIGMTGLLLDAGLNEKQTELAKAANKGGEHLLCVINDILDFSKLEADRVEIESIPVHLPDELDTCLSMFELQLTEKGLEIETTLDDGANTAFLGDPARLRQVLVNYISNAIKFTDTGTITISGKTIETGEPWKWLRIEVQDTGCGIAPEAMERLFQDFTQADSSTTRKYGGTGLGLAISKKIITLMGGRVGADSEPGHGSCFWFEVPAEYVDTAIDDTTDEHINRDAPLRILAAEDHPANQILLRTLLGTLGHEVQIVGTGLKALEALETNTFDMILMDVNMPELDGLDATRRIRAMDGAVKNIPIIGLTAYVMQGDIDECLKAGMSDVLSKPFAPERLVALMQKWAPEPEDHLQAFDDTDSASKSA